MPDEGTAARGDTVSDVKLFALKEQAAQEIPGSAAALEKSLQNLIEGNLDTMLGIRLLESEYSTGPRHGGRIDSLGIDENGCPAIIEYKRATNENVINQGLFYLDWLLDHQGEFELLVLHKYGPDAADAIDWSAPRLLCIAGGFTKYDEYAVQQINRNIELIRYRRFGAELLMLELVNAGSAEARATTGTAGARAATVPSTKVGTDTDASASSRKTASEALAELGGSLQDLYEELQAYLLALGDDVQEKTLKHYVAFKRLRNFACVVVRKASVTVFLKVDPDTVTLEPGFTRDVRNIGHLGPGDLEVTIGNRDALERAKPLFQASYDGS